MIKKEIINKSIDYMFQHIADEIAVGDVAGHFHYSEAYFSRGFKSATGISVYHFLKQIKVNQSAIDLKLKKGRTITEIALDYGYTSSNYSSLFQLHHRLTPSAFRESTNTPSMPNPFRPQVLNTFEDFSVYQSRIKIDQLADKTALYERVLGSYKDIKEKWLQFLETYKEYIPENTLMIERFFDDPAIAAADHCVCDLCATVDASCNLENTIKLIGGKFAVYRYEGEIEEIFCALQGVFSVWLPKSGYEMDRRYGYNIYRSVNKKTESVVMDLCIPLK